MKFTITLQTPEGKEASVEYNFGGDTLPSHIQNIASTISESGAQLTDPLDNYCLESKKGHILDTKSPLPSQLSECDGTTLNFIIKPEIRARRTIDVLSRGDNLKESLFRLRKQLLVR